MALSRRQFLRTAGRLVGGGLVVGGLGMGGLLAWRQPRRQLWAPHVADDDQRPVRLSRPRRVVVIGGGLAGITAATELAARGFVVTLLERAPELGGKLAGWPLELPAALGGRVTMEHGFHGFFRQYYNLGELLVAAGVGADLAPLDGYPVLRPGRPAEVFGGVSSVFPLNLLQVAARSPSLHWGEFPGDAPGLLELTRYREAETFARFDGMSFADFVREVNIHGGIVDAVLRPFGKTTLNALERLSAAEALRFFHFYFMGNPEGLGFSCLGRDVVTAVLAPLARRMEALGVNIRRGALARHLVREGDRVVAVALEGGGADGPRATVDAAAVPERGWLPVDTSEGPVFISRQGSGFRALDGRCTHKGCAVAAVEEGFLCPCHAGRYDDAGRPIAGPPERPLAVLPVHVTGVGKPAGAVSLAVGGPAPVAEETLPCDACVVACEVRGLQRLMRLSDLGPAGAPFVRAVGRMGEADPYAVVRFWLDRPVAPDRAPFYTVGGYDYTDAIAVYSVFQQPFIDWARTRPQGGAVIETHAYAIRPERQGSLGRYRDALLAELRQAFPELREARVLHEEAMTQDNFTRFAPGDRASRPTTTTPLTNLFLAGDHVRLPVPAFLMEAAVVSGRLAANEILRSEGLREIPISTVPLTGPLA
jgi:isorenieratene synthase